VSTELSTELSAIDAIGSARSMRWFTDKPVARELLEKLVWAGTRASNPANTQPWYFVIVQDAARKRALRDAMIRESTGMTGPVPDDPDLDRQIPAEPSQRRSALGSKNALEQLHRVPAIIFICATNNYPAGAPQADKAYSAMFAAGQNMLVAARALGLGAAFTTFHQKAEGTVRAELGIPDSDLIGVTMPVGQPARPFGPVTRRPVDEVIRWDHY